MAQDERKTGEGEGLFRDELRRNAEKLFTTDEIEDEPETAERRFSLENTPAPAPTGDISRPLPPTFWIGASTMTFLVVVFFMALMGATITRFLNNGAQARQNYTPPTDQSMAILDTPGEDPAAEGLSTAQVGYRVLPSVAGVTVYAQGSALPTARQSGIVIRAEGLIATTYRPLKDAGAVGVTLYGGETLLAEVIGFDEAADLAVLHIDRTNLVVPPFADADGTAAGQLVVVAQNPGGASPGVLPGVFSGWSIPDTISGDGAITRYLLADSLGACAGAALADMGGNVMGMCTGDGALSVSIADAKPVLDALVLYGGVPNRGRLGATVRPMDAAAGKAADLPAQGLYIVSLTEDSPLCQAGAAPGDVLLAVEDTQLSAGTDLADALAGHKPGDTLRVRVYLAEKGHADTLKVTLAR